MAGDNGERRITWQVVAIAACFLLVSTSGLVLKGFESRLSAAEADIKLKADKEMVLQMRDDVKDVREMMTSHIIDSGSGRVIRRGR